MLLTKCSHIGELYHSSQSKKILPLTYISLLTVLPFRFLSLTFKQQILLVPPSKCILPLTNFHCLPYYHPSLNHFHTARSNYKIVS